MLKYWKCQLVLNIELLLDEGADVEIPTRSGDDLLHIAAKFGTNGSIKLLLEISKIDVNKRDCTGNTALRIAYCNNKYIKVRTLADDGAVRCPSGELLRYLYSHKIIRLAISFFLPLLARDTEEGQVINSEDIRTLKNVCPEHYNNYIEACQEWQRIGVSEKRFVNLDDIQALKVDHPELRQEKRDVSPLFPTYCSTIELALNLIKEMRIDNKQGRAMETTKKIVYPEEISNHQTRKNKLFQRDKILTRSSRTEKLVNRLKTDRNKFEDFVDKYWTSTFSGGIDSSLITKKGVDLFNQAIIMRDEKTLQTLLDAGVKPKNNLCPFLVAMEIQNTERSMNFLNDAIRQGYKVPVILLELGYQIEVLTQDGPSLLQIAITVGHNHLVKHLIGPGARIDPPVTSDSESSLYLALRVKNIFAIVTLLQYETTLKRNKNSENSN
ncbi:hypothetical protein TSAR_010262 [Trichomalopsis sarcophagae]|uniref:Uncharacterized protein n=1 Tax=Trichomalopsis sarcophagae TaxID=543379 RepID=A0A232EG08_9HYME|nr:hypothetical protein TSAR_010262 [Trichomalopsis sarcophagae]